MKSINLIIKIIKANAIKKITTLFMVLTFGGLFAQHIQQVQVALDINFVQHSVASHEDVYVVVGTVIGGGAPTPPGSDIRVMRVDNSGNILWSMQTF